MLFAIVFLVGTAVGAVCVFAIVLDMRRRLRQRQGQQDAQEKAFEDSRKAIQAGQTELNRQAALLTAQQEEIASQVISYKELQEENLLVKRDLQNIDVQLRKLQLDHQVQQEQQSALDARCQELAGRYFKENVKWIGSSLTTNNFVLCKQRLQSVIERCRAIGLAIGPTQESALVADLKAEFEAAVRAEFERGEQARIKAQIREQQQLEREVERELKQLERERAAIQAALDKALADARGEHTEEIDRLKARLAEAEAKSQRAVSRAQMTKSGYVYVISNIGSFGDGVFKVGMTRRLDPNDRIRELGDASVPFPFDVHLMISSEDAPTLENALHRALHRLRVNRINPRKEFFRTELDAVRRIVEENHGQVEYVADAAALQYRQSLSMSDEDSEYVEGVYDALSDDGEVGDDE